MQRSVRVLVALCLLGCGASGDPMSPPAPVPSPSPPPPPPPPVPPPAPPAPTYDLDALGVPRFAGSDYIPLGSIAMISKFRSGIGHDYSDAFESCRSMKHYFMPMGSLDWSTIPISSPVAGRVDTVFQESAGYQVRIRSTAQPAFTFILFHLNPTIPLTTGTMVAGGQPLGRHIGNQTMSDIAVAVNTPAGYKLVSWFEVMTDAGFAGYAEKGVASRSSAIIPKAARDGDPLGCTGETFGSTGTLENWVTLSAGATPTPADLAGQQLSNGKCTGTAKPPLTRLPMTESDFAFILPYGLMIGGHVTPIDHQYFSPAVFDSPPDAYPVYAIADGDLHSIATRTHSGQGSYTGQTITDHRLVFSLSCRLLYYYDLVTSLAPGLEERLQASNGNLHVSAGELIGRIGNQTLDFAVWDTEHPLTHFIVPSHYNGEAWKIYTADPLDYYDPATRTQALSKYPRTVEPRSGRIDFDVDGFLIGNWFQENPDGSTSGYASGGGTYWDTHLAFAPHFLDPGVFIISIGNWPQPVGASQFVAVEGGPDPAQVTAGTGLVKYTLARYEEDVNGQRWDSMTMPTGAIHVVPLAGDQGCFLVQMLGSREIQAQAFPESSCATVAGFTAGAIKYIR